MLQIGTLPPPSCTSNTYVQASPGVCSVNFCTMDSGKAFCNWSNPFLNDLNRIILFWG